MSKQISIASSDKSIAVLPFANMSADPNNEYFSDGITEEIINALTSIEGLKVIARTSSFSFKGKNIDVRSIGEKLGVNTILEGSVRKFNNRVRITAQLIRAEDGFHLWSKNFDRELINIFELQDEISLLIADQIRNNFGHFNIDNQLIKAPNISIGTYELFLKGKFFLNRFNIEDINNGIAIMKDVLKREPNFALAHVNIHYGYNVLAAGGLMPVKESLSIGKLHLDKALSIDNNLAECYHSLGWHVLNQNWDFINAEKYLAKAIHLKPGYADAHQKLFITLALEGKIKEAYTNISTANQLDPLQPLNSYFLGYYYYIIEQFEDSDFYMSRTFELDNTFIVGYSINALSLLAQKKEKQIFEKAKSIPNIKGADNERLYMETLAYCGLKDLENAQKNIDILYSKLLGDSRERVRFFLIYIETLLENYERALALIEEGIKHKEPLITLIKVDPLLKPLHQFEAFQKMISIVFKRSDENSLKPKIDSHSILSDEEIQSYLLDLNSIIEHEKPFLDSNLSLKQLSDLIDIHPNKLSLFG